MTGGERVLHPWGELLDGPRLRGVMGRALGKRPRPPSRARAPDTAQMTMSLRERPAQQLQQRQGARIDGLRPSWFGTSWSTGDAAACEGPRAGAPVAMAPPRWRQLWPCTSGLTCAGPSTARRRPTLAWGAPSTCSTPLRPPPACTVSALEGPIIRLRVALRPPSTCPFARRLLPRLQQRSVRRSLRRSPRRAAHATAYEGPCAALPVVMGAPLLLPPARLRTCLPPAHQWPLPTSMPLPMLASEAPTLTLVRA